MFNPELLVREIRKMGDPTFSEFEGWPTTTQEAAGRWSEVYFQFALQVAPISTTIIVAKERMRERLLSVNFSDHPRALEEAVEVFALELAKGMSPTFLGIPPSAFLDFTSVYALGFGGGTAGLVAEGIAMKSYEWFVTGTAIMNSGGAIINWS